MPKKSAKKPSASSKRTASKKSPVESDDETPTAKASSKRTASKKSPVESDDETPTAKASSKRTATKKSPVESDDETPTAKASSKRTTSTKSPVESDDETFPPSASSKRTSSTKSHVETSDDESYTPFPNKRKKSENGSDEVKENESSESLVTKTPTCNFINYYKNHEMGFSCKKYKRSLKDIVIKYCQTFEIYKVESPFSKRVTFIVWHPTNPRLLAVTSHWGDIILYDYEKDLKSASVITGLGPGGSIQGMKFDPINPVQIYLASMEGKFQVFNFQTKQTKQFLATNSINRWFISVDVNSKNNIMVAGDTRGNLSVLTLQGEIILDKVQLHKTGFKISHTEFSKREPWLLCTSSTDSTMKLWDIRNLKPERSGMAKPLQTITHEKPINAAYFSLTDGCRLLTTDQKDKIYIYRAPLWDLETVIRHPHRQFQHLTPIKAYWHPFTDIVFVGRYPHSQFPGYHKEELRTIDFFDADTGEMLYQHYQIGCNGILPLNRFNSTGDALASSYGARFLIWKPNFEKLEQLAKKRDMLESKGASLPSSMEDDNCTKDWNAIMKKQTKERLANNSKKKTKTVVVTKTDNAGNDKK